VETEAACEWGQMQGLGRTPPEAESYSKKYAQNVVKSDKECEKNLAVCRLQPTMKRFHLESDSIAQHST